MGDPFSPFLFPEFPCKTNNFADYLTSLPGKIGHQVGSQTDFLFINAEFFP
jgi:hypothetical protein